MTRAEGRGGTGVFTTKIHFSLSLSLKCLK